MKTLKMLFFLLNLNFSLTSFSMDLEERKEDIEQVLSNIPNDIKTYLDRHANEFKELIEKWHNSPDERMSFNTKCIKLKNGEFYFIKYGIERFFNAKKAKAVIEKFKLNLLEIPDKYLYHVPGKSDELSSENFLVVAKGIHGRGGLGDRGIGLDVNHVKQLYIFAIKANHYDIHGANYKLTKDNKVVIIDTDKDAMPSDEKCKELRMDYLQKGDSEVIVGCVQRTYPNDPIQKLALMTYTKWALLNFKPKACEFLSIKIHAREKLRKQRLQEYNKTTNEKMVIIDDTENIDISTLEIDYDWDVINKQKEEKLKRKQELERNKLNFFENILLNCMQIGV